MDGSFEEIQFNPLWSEYSFLFLFFFFFCHNTCFKPYVYFKEINILGNNVSIKGISHLLFISGKTKEMQVAAPREIQRHGNTQSTHTPTPTHHFKHLPATSVYHACSEYYFFSFFFFFVVLELYAWCMEVPRLGVELELYLLAYTTATATWDLSCICKLHHSSRQHLILNSLIEA